MNKITIVFFMLLSFSISNAQTHKLINTINWNAQNELMPLNDSMRINNHEGVYRSGVNITSVNAFFDSISYIPVTKEEYVVLRKRNLQETIQLSTEIASERKTPIVGYSFNPYRINPENKSIEKVEYYEINFTFHENMLKSSSSSRDYSDNSLLATGNWFKIKVSTSGVFKLTYSELVQIGLSEPENVRIYSHGGKQLPYANSQTNHDDLVEIPIKFFNGSDGIFNSGDYVVFYAEGTTTWDYNSSLDMFLHSKHNFSNYTYLFISDTQGSEGLQIEERSADLSPNYSSSSFDSYQCHEVNEYNLINSGRTWYGEKFKPDDSETYEFTFPNIISSEDAKIYTSIVGRKQFSQTCYFSISNNSTELAKIDISGTYGHYTFGKEYKQMFTAPNPSSNFNLEYSFVGVNTNMEGYVDYVCVNTREHLKMEGAQLLFRDKQTVTAGRITQFNINNIGKTISVWNITNAVNPYEVVLSVKDNESSFVVSTELLQDFIVFDGSDYLSPVIDGEDLGRVNNQNLHGVGAYDMIIVTHPDFINQANELAEIHRNSDNLTVFVTQPQTIYNEFSSGITDISAIRNFMRMLYDRAYTIDEAPQYLLLFGDGSYNNWDIGNGNMIPTYQSINSISETSSYVSDDYFGLLDNGEGEIARGASFGIYGKLDIGIGRLPVSDIEEAQLMVDKIKHYMSPESKGDWRTKICFIGDDEDGQLHQKQADYLSEEIVRKGFPEFNSRKIYLDSYKQISTPSGQRHPDVTRAINEQVEKGALIIDYVGHGNPRILAHEEILSATNVRDWNNWDKLSVFITASCEVGRFDDFEKKSLGEWFVLSPNGGGVAAITTTRVVYSGENFELSKTVFSNALKSDLRLGDIIRIAKNERSASGINHRNFTLLGDPALKIAIPENKIVIGNINDNFLSIKSTPSIFDTDTTYAFEYMPGDTILALSKTKIEGYIDDIDGNPLNKDGVLYISIYDKPNTLKIAANDNDNDTLTYNTQNSILYKGRASITRGYYNFEFIVPKDINYKYGNGKISLYAIVDTDEALGYSDNIIIGGNTDSFDSDFDGPQILLYMNDTLFENGGVTNESPIFIAILNDDTGINTTGNGIGHNITAILDGNQDNIYLLNDYYEGDIDKYNSGQVQYPFSDLEPGYHYVTFKTWDIHNNSAESTLEFYVYESNSLVIENMFNSPNPFNSDTWFHFEHNQPFEPFDVTIKIYDIMGSLVAIINQSELSSGYAINPIYWDGTNSAGAKLPKGVYIYRTEITAVDGNKAHESSKLMIF